MEKFLRGPRPRTPVRAVPRTAEHEWYDRVIPMLEQLRLEKGRHMFPLPNPVPEDPRFRMPDVGCILSLAQEARKQKASRSTMGASSSRQEDRSSAPGLPQLPDNALPEPADEPMLDPPPPPALDETMLDAPPLPPPDEPMVDAPPSLPPPPPSPPPPLPPDPAPPLRGLGPPLPGPPPVPVGPHPRAHDMSSMHFTCPPLPQPPSFPAPPPPLPVGDRQGPAAQPHVLGQPHVHNASPFSQAGPPGPPGWSPAHASSSHLAATTHFGAAHANLERSALHHQVPRDPRREHPYSSGHVGPAQLGQSPQSGHHPGPRHALPEGARVPQGAAVGPDPQSQHVGQFHAGGQGGRGGQLSGSSARGTYQMQDSRGPSGPGRGRFGHKQGRGGRGPGPPPKGILKTGGTEVPATGLVRGGGDVLTPANALGAPAETSTFTLGLPGPSSQQPIVR